MAVTLLWTIAAKCHGKLRLIFHAVHGCSIRMAVPCALPTAFAFISLREGDCTRHFTHPLLRFLWQNVLRGNPKWVTANPTCEVWLASFRHVSCFMETEAMSQISCLIADSLKPGTLRGMSMHVALLAGTLAASLAGSFMVIFEQCSDSLLYIFRWNKAHGHNTVAKYCPDELAKLMEYKKVFAGDGMRNRPEPPGIFSTLLSSSA
ncbi:hypothetical protein AK812_SmicGene40672 [Symbiodinium microadriaticum]|uniref:Uncharacterized protein n=1 Tax=Symbiodinium microadriaticum TaxID=2951 RepID=A0A1Q9C865_SYMMI|nr:hypothetical protein AK812_SmicGene40672 [Symbiodinium microadriaticum]